MGMVIAPAWLRQVTRPPLLHITTLTTAKNLVFPQKTYQVFFGIWAENYPLLQKANNKTVV